MHEDHHLRYCVRLDHGHTLIPQTGTMKLRDSHMPHLDLGIGAQNFNSLNFILTSVITSCVMAAEGGNKYK